MGIQQNVNDSYPTIPINKEDSYAVDRVAPRLTINGPRLTIKSKLPLRPGLAPKNTFISSSLRNVTTAIGYHLRTFVASQKAPLQFCISPSDLSNLASERTLLALAEILERALDEEKDAASKLLFQEHVYLGSPEEGENSNGAGKTSGKSKNHEPLYDAESPDDQGKLSSNVRALIQKIRFLEEQPNSENIRLQKNLAAEVAANALAIIVLKSSPSTGLDLVANPLQMQQRREIFGVNAMSPKRLTTFLQFCWEAVQDPVLLLLICLGVVSTVVEMTLGHEPGTTCSTCWIEGAAIIFAVFVVVMVTSSIGYQKQKSFVKLSKTLDVSNTKSVVRNGEVLSVVDSEIVVGDIISVNSHNAANIPADGVFLGSFADSMLCVDESSLTGESEAVVKRPGDILLSGTALVQGSGKLVVIAVGVNSVGGKIKASVYESAESNDELKGDDETPLFSKLSKLAKSIGLGGTAAAILAFLASLILGLGIKRDPATKIVEYFIVSVTVLAVAVPEGLPLAVTLSLAFSSQRMTKEENLVKHLDACETMGCATTICTDKTGTLTANKMTTRAMYTNGQDFVCPSPSVSLGSMILNTECPLSTHLLGTIADLISIATMNESVLHFKEENGKKDIIGSDGNPTECALLQLVEDIGFHYVDIRNNTRGRSDVFGMARFLSEAKKFDFSSARKMMSWAVPREEGGHRIYCKGASEVVFNRCTSVLLSTGETTLSDGQRSAISDISDRYAQRGMRCLSLAYRDLPQGTNWEFESDRILNADGSPANEVETNLIFLALVGIEDPLRVEVPEAIRRCYEAGIDVRMVTGDSPNTSVSIAYQAGILREEHFKPVGAEGEQQQYVVDNLKENVLLEGKAFRAKVFRTFEGKKEFDQLAFDKIWPHLRVLARSSPDDKLALAHGLNQSALFADKDKVRQLWMDHGINVFPDRQVVAMTGDGTNDAPALKRADIGFAMGISGTQIAKDAADIILLDDNFASIVTAAKWGRNVYASIQKFLQFQLTVNLTAVTTALVGSFAYQRTSLAAIQLLWVNLLMDSLASLALASEPPDAELLKKPPINRSEHMITNRMWVNISGQATYQLVVVLLLLFNGPAWFGFDPGHCVMTTNCLYPGSIGKNSIHYTLIFNSFVWMQLFNEINCRNISGGFNVFRGIFKNPLFYGVWITTAVLQIIMVEVGSYAMAVVPGGLNWKYWGVSLACGLGSFPIQQLINLAFRVFENRNFLRNRGLLKINTEMLTRDINEKKPRRLSTVVF